MILFSLKVIILRDEIEILPTFCLCFIVHYTLSLRPEFYISRVSFNVPPKHIHTLLNLDLTDTFVQPFYFRCEIQIRRDTHDNHAIRHNKKPLDNYHQNLSTSTKETNQIKQSDITMRNIIIYIIIPVMYKVHNTSFNYLIITIMITFPCLLLSKVTLSCP